jgi:hypothetical protein
MTPRGTQRAPARDGVTADVLLALRTRVSGRRALEGIPRPGFVGCIAAEVGEYAVPPTVVVSPGACDDAYEPSGVGTGSRCFPLHAIVCQQTQHVSPPQLDVRRPMSRCPRS